MGEGSEETLWDAKDVATYLKVSRNWVYDQVARGRLPHVKIGGLVRFHPEQIRAVARGEAPAGGRVLAFDASGKR